MADTAAAASEKVQYQNNDDPRTVNVSGLPEETTEEELRKFFTFCGNIQDVALKDEATGKVATIRFSSEAAAETAALLSGAKLSDKADQSITVARKAPPSSTKPTSEEVESPTGGAPGEDSEEIKQHQKPRTARLAEMLAHGYDLGDSAIQQAVDLDEKHGISEKFRIWFNELLGRGKQLDEKTKATERATELANKVGAQEKAKRAYGVGVEYYEKALKSPVGQRVEQFYIGAKRQVSDVHAEAQRIREARNSSQTTTAQGEGEKTEEKTE